MRPTDPIPLTVLEAVLRDVEVDLTGHDMFGIADEVIRRLAAPENPAHRPTSTEEK